MAVLIIGCAVGICVSLAVGSSAAAWTFFWCMLALMGFAALFSTGRD